MTEEQRKIINELRGEGYAITVFTPEELEGVESRRIEDCMCERAWSAIEDLKIP